jgi:hypothetical protein
MSKFVQELYNSYGHDVILKPYWGGSLPDFPLSNSPSHAEDTDNDYLYSDNDSIGSDNDSIDNESATIVIESILENVNQSKNNVKGGTIVENMKEKIVDYGSDIAISAKSHTKNQAKQSILNYMNNIQ